MKVRATCRPVVILLLSLAVGACAAGEAGSGDLEVALKVSDAATAADAGLPPYPGAQPYTDGDSSSSAANLGFSSPLFGVKLIAVKLQTADAPERVAAFYRQALSKYGVVLDCSDPRAKDRKSEPPAEHGEELVCDSNDGESHDVVYKVGTEKHQRIVAIEPHGRGARFSLVRLDVRGDSQP
jgi:hypothetical protein